jgi:hypothetical protein
MIHRPIINSAAAKADVLERRRQHLERRASERNRGGQAASFDLAEASALTAGIEALAWYAQEATDQRGSTPLGLLNRLLEVDADDVAAVVRIQQETKELVKGLLD